MRNYKLLGNYVEVIRAIRNLNKKISLGGDREGRTGHIY